MTKPGENTQGARLVKFGNAREIAGLETTLRAYIPEAIEVEKAGLKVNYKKTSEFPIPEEFRSKLAESPALKTAFEALDARRQKSRPTFYFSAAKQSKSPGRPGLKNAGRKFSGERD